MFAVDPGTTTGAGYGLFPVGMVAGTGGGGVWDVAREALKMGAVETWEETGPPPLQARELAGEIEDWWFRVHVEGQVSADDMYLVVEDFALRGGQKVAELLDPVRVTSGLEALLLGHPALIEGVSAARQQPGAAKGYATSERLKRHGLWVRGSDHRRDAMRHMLTCLSRVMAG